MQYKPLGLRLYTHPYLICRIAFINRLTKEEQEAEGSGEQENTEQAKDAQEQSQEQPEVQEEQQTK